MNKDIINYIKTLSDNDTIQEILIKTIGNLLLKQNNIEIFIKNNEDKIVHIRDWIYSVIESNEQWKTPRVLTIDALYNMADKYFEKKNNKLTTIELNEKEEKLIANLGEYYIVQMLTPEVLDNESKVMQHCIGHGYYDKNLNNLEEYQYLSLRDKFNKAHVTLEIWHERVLQLQGKQNKIPERKYLNILIPWLKNNSIQIELSKYKLVLNTNDNKIYSVFDMPDNCNINDDLFLGNLFITKLPKNLSIQKSLFLSYTVLRELPEDIKIRECLDLTFSHIEKIPDNFSCKAIYMEKNRINLINETMNFETIFINSIPFSRKDFFENIYNKENNLYFSYK